MNGCVYRSEFTLLEYSPRQPAGCATHQDVMPGGLEVPQKESFQRPQAQANCHPTTRIFKTSCAAPSTASFSLRASEPVSPGPPRSPSIYIQPADPSRGLFRLPSDPPAVQLLQTSPLTPQRQGAIPSVYRARQFRWRALQRTPASPGRQGPVALSPGTRSGGARMVSGPVRAVNPAPMEAGQNRDPAAQATGSREG